MIRKFFLPHLGNRSKSDPCSYELFCLESHILSFPKVLQIPPESLCITGQNFMNQTSYCEPAVQSYIQEISRLLRKRMLFFFFRIDPFWTHSYPEVPSPHSHTRLLYYHFDISEAVSFIHVTDYNFGWLFQLRCTWYVKEVCLILRPFGEDQIPNSRCVMKMNKFLDCSTPYSLWFLVNF